MTDTQVVVVSLAIGLAVGIALLMVIWACRACLGKPKTADDDNTARDAAGRRQPAAEPAAAPAQQVNVELPVGLERAHHDPSATSQSPKVQRSHPPAAINFPNEAIAPSPNLSVPSPGPCPTAPSPFSTKASPQIAIPCGPMAFASPSPLPTRLSNHGLLDTPSPQPAKPRTVDSSTSATSSMVTATPTAGPGASNVLPPSPLPAAALSTSTSNPQPAAVPTLAQLDPTVPEPTPTTGLLSGPDPQGTLMSPLPSGVPTHSSDIPSDASVDPAAVTIGEDGVPALNLGRINEARAKRHNANPRTYPDPSSSVVGTTAEIGPNSDASAIRNAKTLSTAAGSYRMPAPLQTVSATQSLESHQAQLMARAAVTEELKAKSKAEAANENKEASKTTAASIESHNITEGPSTAVSDAAVTIGGLTMRGIVDQPHPIDPEGGETSYTAALEMATGVEAVEGAASFVTADDGESPGNENEADVDLDPTTSAEMSRKGEVHPTHMSPSGTALLAHFEELDDEDEYDVGTPHTGFDTGRTVGPQSLAFMEGGQRYCHQAQVSDLDDVNRGGCYTDGSATPTGYNDAEPSDLPPGAIVRGRDPLMDHLMSSKLSQELPEGFSRTTSADMGRNGANSAAQSPLGTPHGANNSNMSGLGGSNFSGMGGGWKSNFSENYRFIPDSNCDSLLSIPINPALEYPGETETFTDLPTDSVAISEASEWTLSAPTRAMGGGPSSALSRGTSAAHGRRYVPSGYAESMASGVSAAFSEASDWTLSGGNTRQMPALRGLGAARSRHGPAFSPLPSPSTRSQLGQSNGLTAGLGSSRSGASNWTLSGNTGKVGGPSQRFSQASRALDDGRSIAFTDGGSEWALSPRSAVVRDDLDVGHSDKWMQPDEIKMPARPSPQTSNTRGLRDKYAKKTLRQKYASDDANVPEYAVRRVNDWMGDMGDTRDEVMLRLTAQQNDY